MRLALTSRSPAAEAGAAPGSQTARRGSDTPVGELDLVTVVQLESELRDLRKAGFRRFVLDLRELTFIDSTGLHLALTWDAYARSDGIDFELIEGSRSIQRIFEITGVKEQLSFR